MYCFSSQCARVLLLLLLLKLQLLSRFVARVAECPEVFLGLEGKRKGRDFFFSLSFSTLCILEARVT